MSKFKGTPGPWEVINEVDVFTRLGSKNGSGVSADVSDGWHVADCNMGETMTQDGYQSIPFAEQKANARLIAAAPKLLDAAIMAIEHYDAYFGGSAPDDLPWVPVMREAIKEALGEDAP